MRAIALVAWLGLAFTSPAFAAELLIAAPSACPIDDDLAFRAEQALGQSLASGADVRCTVHISRDGANYAARLEVQPIGSTEPPRQRALAAPSCEKLTETLALAISLAIASGAEPSERAPNSASSASGAPAPPASAETTTLASVQDEPRADEPRADEPRSGAAERAPLGLRVGAAASLVGDAGSLPGAGAGAALGASLGYDSFELRLLGTYLPPRSASVQSFEAGAVGAEISLLAGSLLACAPRVVQATDRLALGACTGAELGWIEGTGTGVDVSRSGGSWWTSLRADAEARWMLGPGLGIGLTLSALVPWDRDEFAIDGVGRVFRPGRVVGRAAIGLSYELGAPSE